MKNYLLFSIFIFCISGCIPNNTPKTIKAKPNVPKTEIPNNKSNINTIRETNFLKREKIASFIEKIISTNGAIIYKSGALISGHGVDVDSGIYKIQFRCLYRDSYNYNWVQATIGEKENYIVYCLKETDGKTGFGFEKIPQFFPFISTIKNFESDSLANQKLIDNPSQNALDRPIEEGKTRLVIYNAKPSLVDFNYTYVYKVFINGKFYDNLDQHKYIIVDLDNGESNLEVHYIDAFTFKNNLKISLDGGVKYIACSNGLVSVSIDVNSTIPEDFKLVYKPQDPFKL